MKGVPFVVSVVFKNGVNETANNDFVVKNVSEFFSVQ